MKIWHQSITDLTELPDYAGSLRATAASFTSPGTEVSVHGVEPGTYPAGMAPIVALRSAWFEHLLAAQVVLGALRAEREGYDAVTVSCFFDPGIRAARELVSIPVLTACETSVTVALSVAEKIALIALEPEQVEFLRRLVDSYGLADRVVAILPLDPPVTELELQTGLDIDDVVLRVEEAAARAVRFGADVIIPAEGYLNSLLARHGVTTLAGRPCVDAFAALLLHAELSVRLGLLGGRKNVAPRRQDDLDHFHAVTARALSLPAASGEPG